MADDLRAVLRLAAGQAAEPGAAILAVRLAKAIQDTTGDSVNLVYVDQGYTGRSLRLSFGHVLEVQDRHCWKTGLALRRSPPPIALSLDPNRLAREQLKAGSFPGRERYDQIPAVAASRVSLHRLLNLHQP